MKNYVLTVLFFAGFFMTAFAQDGQAQSSTSKISDKNLTRSQAGTVDEMITNIDAVVKLTDDQKTKLHEALLQSLEKSEVARKEALKDDTKLQAWREAKVADIKAQLKTILTPAQYEQVLKAGDSK